MLIIYNLHELLKLSSYKIICCFYIFKTVSQNFLLHLSEDIYRTFVNNIFTVHFLFIYVSKDKKYHQCFRDSLQSALYYVCVYYFIKKHFSNIYYRKQRQRSNILYILRIFWKIFCT